MVKWTGGGSERPFNQSAANGRNEPTLTNAARSTNGRYHESCQKPSIITQFLNGGFGIALG